MRSLFFLVFIFTNIFAVNIVSLQYIGIEVEHTFSNDKKEKYLIERVVDSECLNIGINAQTFKEEHKINNKCKKTVISTVGVIQPLYINKDIKTYGELEVLEFIYKYSSKDTKNYVLVDARNSSWFDLKTIPSSVNIPYGDLKYDEDFEEEFYEAYKKLGVKVIEKNKFDFSQAKTALFFCNASWCPISSKTINYLLSIGYPKEKLLWYRGGIASWEALSLTLTKSLK